ncbi:hypothetical protein ACTXT7_004876 [Hymenolepis weldensis]
MAVLGGPCINLTSEFPSEKVDAIELIDDQMNEERENSNTAMYRMASKEPSQFKILGTRAELELPMIPGMPETREYGYGMGGHSVRYIRARNPKGSKTINDYLKICNLSPISAKDIKDDEMFVHMYLPPVSNDFMMSPLMRAAAVDWMTGMQVLFDTDVTALHIATLLLDSYTWLNRKIKPRDYLKIVVVSLISAIKMTKEGIVLADLITGVHEFCKQLFTIDEIRKALKKFESEFAHEGFKKLIPHYYLLHCLQVMPDFERNMWKKFVALCLYLLDLGALNIGLVPYSARVKCAGVVCCVREVFRKFCDCSYEEKHDPRIRCLYHRMLPMSVEMQEVLQLRYNDQVRSAAQIYKKMLVQAKKISQSPIPAYTKNCSEPFMAAYNKFKSDAYFGIARADKLPSLDED